MDQPNTCPSRGHVVVVNDDQAVLQLFSDLLTEEGYRVTLDTFDRTTAQVMDDIAKAQPDLVILDYIIGGEARGWQLLQALKMNRATTSIAILVSTAAVRQANELSAHLTSLGIELVIKPFDIDQLIAAVDRTLARRDRDGS